MMIKNLIEQTITENFKPSQLEVIDESHKHAGHAGSHPEGESHFLIRVSASAFQDVSRVQREKMLHKAINAAMPREIHAIRFEFV